MTATRYDMPLPSVASSTPGRTWGLVLGAISVLFVFCLVGSSSGNLSNFFCSGALLTLPAAFVAQLAYAAESYRCARIATWWLVGLVVALLVAASLGFVVKSAQGNDVKVMYGLIYSMGGLICTAVVMKFDLLPGVPANLRLVRHRAALWLVLPGTFFLVLPLALTGRTVMEELVSDGDAGAPIREAIQLLLLAPTAFVCAGWPTVRNARLTIDRLGLRHWTWAQLVVAVVFGAVLAFAFVFALIPAVDALWKTLGLRSTDMTTLEQVVSGEMPILQCILLGVSAGVGEELIFRGLLQPRMGVWLSTALFAGGHALQYQWDGVVVIVALGLVLAYARIRYNTVVAAAIHASYNITLLAGVF